MIKKKLRRMRRGYALAFTSEEIERLGLREGDGLEVRPTLRPELQKIVDESWPSTRPRTGTSASADARLG